MMLNGKKIGAIALLLLTLCFAASLIMSCSIPSVSTDSSAKTETKIPAETSSVAESDSTGGGTSVESPDNTSDSPSISSNPAVTTNAPDDTTKKQNEITTAAQTDKTETQTVVTTKKADTTKSPDVTTKTPEITTKTPDITTKSPEITTKSPEVTSKTPVTTKAPETTNSPVTTKPVVTTAPHVHTPTPIPAVAATCVKTGLTEGSKCSVCSQILVAQTVTQKTSHTPSVSKPAVAATERTLGYTAESACSVCKTVTSKRSVIPATGYKNPALYSSDWGYNYLSKLSNGAKRQAFYKAFDEICLDFHKNNKNADMTTTHTFAELTNLLNSCNYKVVKDICASSYGLQLSEVVETWSLYRADHPLYYWLGTTYVNYTCGNDLYFPVVCDANYAQGSVRATLNEKIYTDMASTHLAAAEKVSIYGQALAIHDKICERIEYKFIDGTNQPDMTMEAHCILGWFTDYGGVCECYAKTYQLMMNYCGFECITVINIYHMWNLMKFDDGKWYWVDVTFDDPYNVQTMITDLYFCKNDTEDIFAGSKYIGSGTFFDNVNHITMTSGGFNTQLGNQFEGCGYASTVTYGQIGLFIIPELPDRSTTSYSGNKN